MPGVPGRPWRYATPSRLPARSNGWPRSANWLAWKTDWLRDARDPALAADARSSRAATRAIWRASSAIAQSFPSPATKRRECARHVLVREPIAERRTAPATGLDNIASATHAAAPRGSGRRSRRATGRGSRTGAPAHRSTSSSSRAASVLRAPRTPARLADDLAIRAAVDVEGREAAGERLQQRVRAGLVEAREDEDVMLAEQLRDLARRHGRNHARALERHGRAADERQREAGRVEAALEVGDDVGALPRVVGPARRDQPDRRAGAERNAAVGVEDRRVGRVRDDDGLAQLEAELPVLVEAVARLEHGRVRVHAVEVGDVPVGAVVEAAVDADRPVDPVHHAAARAGEAAQPPVVEVERVEEAGRRPAGDPVDLDVEPAPPELAARALRGTGSRPPTAAARTRGRRRGRRDRGATRDASPRCPPPGARRASRCGRERTRRVVRRAESHAGECVGSSVDAPPANEARPAHRAHREEDRRAASRSCAPRRRRSSAGSSRRTRSTTAARKPDGAAALRAGADRRSTTCSGVSLDDLEQRDYAILPFAELFRDEAVGTASKRRARAFVERRRSATSPRRRARRRRAQGLPRAPLHVGVSEVLAELAVARVLPLGPRMLGLANAYLQMWSKLEYVDFWYSVPVEADSGRIQSQRWHRDFDDRHLLKAFLYLVDVDEETGPFEFVAGARPGASSATSTRGTRAATTTRRRTSSTSGSTGKQVKTFTAPRDDDPLQHERLPPRRASRRGSRGCWRRRRIAHPASLASLTERATVCRGAPSGRSRPRSVTRSALSI